MRWERVSRKGRPAGRIAPGGNSGNRKGSGKNQNGIDEPYETYCFGSNVKRISQHLHLTRLLVVSGILVPASLDATVLLTESFDYGTTDSDTKFLRGDNDHNGGTGWADEWKAVSGDPDATGGIRLNTTAAVTQSYPAGTDLVGTGSRISDSFGGTSERQMTTTIDMSDPGDLYFSALVNWTTGSSATADFRRSSDGITRWTAFDIDSSGNVKAGVFGLSAGSVSLTTGVDYLIVGKLERNSGSTDDIASLSVFQVSSPGSFLSEPVSWDLTHSSSSGVVMDFFRVSAGGGGTSIIDEVRLGTTYADVVGVPEPSSAALLGLGGLVLVSRRRRQAA